ncbi:MAG: MoaD/ThiS family protein [Thermoleophilia bacterium]
MPADIEMTVLLFASLRQAAGVERITLRVPLGTPVGAVWGLLPEPLSTIPVPSALRYAVNEQWVQPGTHVADGDRVALVLPVSGG